MRSKVAKLLNRAAVLKVAPRLDEPGSKPNHGVRPARASLMKRQAKVWKKVWKARPRNARAGLREGFEKFCTPVIAGGASK